MVLRDKMSLTEDMGLIFGRVVKVMGDSFAIS